MPYQSAHVDPNELRSTTVAADPLLVIKLRIQEKMRLVLTGAVYDYIRVMRDWNHRYTPRETGRLEMGMNHIIDTSGAISSGGLFMANFRLGAPAPYAQHVNRMGPKTNWGSSGSPLANPDAKTHFYDEAYNFANTLIRNILIKHIRLNALDQKFKVSAEQFYQRFFGGRDIILR